MKWKVLDASRLVLYVMVIVLLLALPIRFFEEYSFCLYYNLFGIRCPGCGGTRAIVHLLHANFSQAWQFNPFAVCIFPFLLFLAVQDIVCILYRWWPGRKGKERCSVVDWIFGRSRSLQESLGGDVRKDGRGCEKEKDWLL